MPRADDSVWSQVWRLTALLNLFGIVLIVLWLGKRHLTYDGDWKASDLVVIVLAAVTVVLAALAIALGALAIWGFGEIKRAAETAARTAARETAREVATAVAQPVAAREALDSREVLQNTPDSAIGPSVRSELGPLGEALSL